MENLSRLNRNITVSFNNVRNDINELKKRLNEELSVIEDTRSNLSDFTSKKEFLDYVSKLDSEIRAVEESYTSSELFEKYKESVIKRIKELEEKVSEKEALESDISDIKENVSALKEKSVTKDDTENVKEEINALKERFDKREEIANKLSDIESVKRQLKRVGEIKAQKSDVEKLITNIDDLSRKVESVDKEKLVLTDLDELKKNIAEIKESVVLKTGYVKQTKDIEELKNALKDLTASVDKVDIGKADKEGYEQLRKSFLLKPELEKSNSDLKKDLVKRINQIKITIEDIELKRKDNNDEINSRIDQLDNDKITAKDFDELINSTKNELKGLSVKLQKFEKKYDTIIKEIEDDFNSFDSLKSDRKEVVEDIKDINEQFEAKISDIKKNLNSIGDKNAELIEEVQKNMDELSINSVSREEFQDTNEKNAKSVQALRNNIGEVNKRIDNLTNDTDSNYEKAEETKVDRAEFNDRLDVLDKDLSNKVSRLQKEIKSMLSNVSDNKGESFSSISEIDDKKIDRLEFNDSIEGLREDIRGEVDKKVAEVEKLKEQIIDFEGNTVTSAFFDQQLGDIQAKIDNLEKMSEKLGDVQEDGASIQSLAKVQEELNRTVRRTTEIEAKLVDKRSLAGFVNQVNSQEAKVKSLEKEFTSSVAANTALYKEIKGLNIRLDKERRLDLDRRKMEKRIEEYKEGRINELKSVIFYVFVGILILALIIFSLFKTSGAGLPGLRSKIITVLIILVILLILLWLPYDKIIPPIQNWWKVIAKEYKTKKEDISRIKKREIAREKKREVKKTAEKKEVGEAPGVLPKLFMFLFAVGILLLLIVIIANSFGWLASISITKLLILTVIVGIIGIALSYKEMAKSTINYPLVILAGISIGLYIFTKTGRYGWLSYIISIISALIIVFVLSMFYENGEAKGKKEEDEKGVIDKVVDFFTEEEDEIVEEKKPAKKEKEKKVKKEAKAEKKVEIEEEEEKESSIWILWLILLIVVFIVFVAVVLGVIYGIYKLIRYLLRVLYPYIYAHKWTLLGIIVAIIVIYLVYYLIRKAQQSEEKIEGKWFNYLKILVNVVFYLSLLWILVLLIYEIVKWVLFVNINYFLAIVIVLGILAHWLKPEGVKKKSFLTSVIIGLIGALFVYTKIMAIGPWKYVVAIVVFIVILVIDKWISEDIDEI